MTGRRIISGGRRWSGFAAVLSALAVSATPVDAQTASASEAPFGDKVGPRIPFYDRVAPQVATSGPLDRLGIIEAKSVGFASIVDLRQSKEASDEERQVAQFALIAYHNLPVADILPTDEEIAAFTELVEDSQNQPVLVHGATLDQAAAMWALHRAAKGVAPETAFFEGRTAGLGASAARLRERLGLPAEIPAAAN